MHMQDFDPGRGRPGRLAYLSRVPGGLAAFGVTVALMLLVAAPAQARWGLGGLAVTELMVLAIALLFGGASGRPLKAVFPIRRPTGRQVAATLILWGGYLGLALSATLAMALWFPREVLGVSQGVGRLMAQWPLPAALLASALLPAICEEALCRGYIHHSFARVRSRWLAMAAAAALFGALHFSPFRFLPTAVLGFALAYLRERTGSLALPMLFHFVNNAFSTVSGYLAQAAPPSAEAAPLDALASAPALVCLYALLSPAAILAGSILLGPPRPMGVRHKYRDKRGQFIVAAVLTVLLLAGFLLGMAPMAQAVANSGQPLPG